MKPLRLSLLSAAVVCAVAPAWADPTQPLQGIRDNSAQLLAFTGAVVHTEPGKTLTNATVLVQSGKITAVGTDLKIPAGFQQINVAGYHLYPGFIDLYSQYGVEKAAATSHGSLSDGPMYQNARKGGNAVNAAIHAEQRWADSFSPNADDAKAYQQQGFTVVQSARQDGIFRGQALLASTGKGLPGELILKADGQHFLSFDPGSSKQSYPSSLMGSIALVRQTLADAQWYQHAYGKTDWRLFREPAPFNAALAALGQLNQSGLVFEISNERNLLRADSLLKEFNLPKVALVASGYEYVRAAEVKKTGRNLIVPVAYPAAPSVGKLDDQLDVSLADLRHWERAPTNPAALEKAGVNFALTTHKLDDKTKFWPNVRTAIKYGLSTEKALAALTTVPAELIGMPGQLGRIASGYQADLVVSKGDLFKDGEIVATWNRGVETQFKPLQNADVAGDYALNIGGKALTLNLSGALGKVEGKVVPAAKSADKDADKEAKLENLSVDKQQVQFGFSLKDLDAGDGVALFSGVMAGNLLQGTLQLPDGSQQALTLSRQAAVAKVDEKKADDSSLLSQLSLPNQAYGLMSSPQRQNVHIKNATVWTSDKAGKLENTDVIVRNGVFTDIGKNLKTPSGFVEIDATGMHVTAGIIDEHSHIAIESGVNEGSDAVTSEVHIGDVLNPDDINIYRGLAGGTTTAQLLHGSANPIGGQAQVIQLRWGVSQDALKFKAAPASIKFALGENVKQSNWGDNYTSRYPQSRVGVETTIRDAFQAAKEYKAAWADYDDLSSSEQKRTVPPRVDYRLQTLVEILDNKRFVHTHSYVASEILMLIKLADETGFKVTTFTHILEGYKTAKEMAAHGASASTFADWWAYKMEVKDAIPTNTCLMADQGVVVSVNSDSPDLQRRLNQEAAKSVKYCGMSEEEALKMITINPAIQLKVDQKVGSIAEGKQADFVLWSEHPLSVYAKAMQTWIDGTKYYDRNVDMTLNAGIEREKQQLIQKVLKAPEDRKAGSGGEMKKPEPIWHCEDNGDFLDLAFGRVSAAHQHAHQH